MTGPLPQIPNVFLSGTYTDLRQHRELACEAVALAEALALDFPDWTREHASVQTIVQDRLGKEADIYLGLFGFQYGALLKADARGRSITRFEYDVARERWSRSPYPPMFIFRPTDNPDCANRSEIEESCRRAVATRYEGDETRIEEDFRLQREFLRELEGITQPFCGREDLAARIVASISNFRGKLLQETVDSQRGILRQFNLLITSELRKLGRRPQISRAEAAYAAFLRRKPTCPALCLLAHGAPGTGSSSFAHTLLAEDLWKSDHCPQPVFVDTSMDTAATVWSALWRASGYPPPRNWNDPAALAKAIAATCRERPVVACFVDMQSYPEGLGHFVTRIWGPLVAELRALCEVASFKNRLYLLLAAELTDGKLPSEHCWTGEADDPGIDYARIVTLPALAPITADDVTQSLQFLGLPTDERWQIAREVLRDGEPDGVRYRLYQNSAVQRALETIKANDRAPTR